MPSETIAITAAVDHRMIAAMRLVLASSALLIIYLDPSEPDRLVPVTYSALVLYTVYSLLLLLFAIRLPTLVQWVEKWWHWADVGWYLLLISLSSGTSSIFFYFFFFSVLVASFRHGGVSGLRVVIVSSLLFTVIGYLVATAQHNFELNRFLLRPMYLLVLGYMMAYWGGHETTLRRRLALLKEVSAISNPRFGIDRTTGMIMERLRAFYEADSCVIIARQIEDGEYRLRRNSLHDPEGGAYAQEVANELTGRLLTFPVELAIVYRHLPRWWLWNNTYYAIDTSTGKRAYKGRLESAGIAELLDGRSFVTVPMYYHKEIAGRIYLSSRRPRAFTQSDSHFLLHVLEQVMPVLDNVRLVDQLASNAAEQERQRIARNIHDSVIQPYLGLQIGLTTVRRVLTVSIAAKNGDHEELKETVNHMIGRIDRLIEMANSGIADLRRYVSGLKEGGEQEGGLVPAIRRFAATFSEATGIIVEVESDGVIEVHDRLGAEAFQMVTEGLSNVRRHTQANMAIVSLTCRDGCLRLKIENDNASLSEREEFTPKSISGRAEALGGRAFVEKLDGRVSVSIEVPL